MIDVSLVLNLHRESKFLIRTLLSIKDASDYARLYSITIELVVVLDRPDALTTHVLKQFDLGVFDHAKVIEVDRGSLGLARNDGIAQARGKYVRLCDGDDLISFNLISAMYFEAERLGSRAILVSEWLFAFGERQHCGQYSDLEIVTPMSMIDIHPFISQIFFDRSLFDQLQFEDLRLSIGYAYEDWHFATEAVALGYSFHIARDTAFFYRQRAGSLLTQANGISVRQISPSRLFVPSVFLRVCAESYRRYLNGEVRRDAGDARAYIDSAVGRHQFWAANLIEPAIDPKIIRQSDQYCVSKASNLNIGRYYYEICHKLGDQTYSDIFILPYFGSGGAERYIYNIIVELRSLFEDASILLILGEPHPDNEWLSRFPTCVKSIDLAQYVDEIGDQGADLITLKLIQSLGSGARLHFRQSVFSERFLSLFGRVLSHNIRIYYRFCQARYIDNDETFFAPWAFQFLSEQIEHIDAIITDNKKVIEFDRMRFGVTPEKWHFLPTLYEAPVDRDNAIQKSHRSSPRILWASRIALQKRPEVLMAVARKLQRKWRDAVIDVYGQSSPEFDSTQFGECYNIVYHGGYSHFTDINIDGYLCFMYTSAFDGIPTVLLEAAGVGLPIIAPDVGAVDEFVENEVTGILVRNIPDIEQMADAYITAIVRLESDPGLRAKIAEQAYDRAISSHALAVYRKCLTDIMEAVSG